MQYGNSRIIRNTPVITAVAYSAGDVVGGEINLGAIGSPNYSGVLKNISIVDKANQKAALTVLFFEGDLSGGTYDDNGALTLTAADWAKFLGKVEVVAGDYTTINSRAYATVEASIIVKTDTLKQLRAIVVTTGTPTYAVGDLLFTYGILGD